ncbi:putative MRAS2 [Operophtera brumata]|uniref:small monomeric GTPase n=1 Tax=Operophtera brumata TaxID=104452 RepID=A0A0L7L323_OPEBR|nr:putative MRAS2 [Operophtera brumata]
MSTTTSPKTSIAKLVLYPKPKPFKVMVLGQSGVGKSEKTYQFQTVIDNEMVYFEILDSAGESHESEYANLENNIRWAEAFILMYSVTDKCSFDECHRLKFLINYNKRRRRLTSSTKIDQGGDRMVTTDEGQRRSKEIGRSECAEEFRARASTDSRLPPRPARARHPLSSRPFPPPVRRMSVAMRGNNANSY